MEDDHLSVSEPANSMSMTRRTFHQCWRSRPVPICGMATTLTLDLELLAQGVAPPRQAIVRGGFGDEMENVAIDLEAVWLKHQAHCRHLSWLEVHGAELLHVAEALARNSTASPAPTQCARAAPRGASLKRFPTVTYYHLGTSQVERW